MSNAAFISGKVLTWALKRSGLDIEKLVTRTTSVEDILGWEKGETLPTEAQAEDLAKKLGIPYAMLLMEYPPKDDTQKIPDLRTLTGRPVELPSLHFRELLDDTQIRQDWCRAERIDQKLPPLRFVSSFGLDDEPTRVARDMRATLGIDNEFRATCENYKDFQKRLVGSAEDCGILVMRSAIVKHSTKKTLNVSEFRGFALADKYAPVAFINDGDAAAAQIFTLAHELCHIWIGKDGVSDQEPTEKTPSHNHIEIFCDQVAAEFLVPAEDFSSRWITANTIQQNIRSLSEFFRVSSLVILRRALELGNIPLEVFKPTAHAEYERFKLREAQITLKQKKAKKKGGNFWASFELRNGASFNATVIDSVRGRRTTYTEAASLLGVSLAATVRYVRRMSVA
jgi:Zn-dependent peptidase ImmA (M78 family)